MLQVTLATRIQTSQLQKIDKNTWSGAGDYLSAGTLFNNMELVTVSGGSGNRTRSDCFDCTAPVGRTRPERITWTWCALSLHSTVSRSLPFVPPAQDKRPDLENDLEEAWAPRHSQEPKNWVGSAPHRTARHAQSFPLICPLFSLFIILVWDD